MAHVAKRTLADGKTLRYDVVYVGPDGKERSETFSRKAAANDRRVEIESQLRRGDWLDPDAGKVKLGEYAAAWLEGRRLELRPSTAHRYRQIIEGRIAPGIGRTPLNRISHEQVAAWLTSIADPAGQGKSIGEARVTRSVLTQVMDMAVRTNRIRVNPVKGVRLPMQPKSSRRATGPGSHIYLTHEQVAALADCAGARGLEVLLLAYCGLRWSELAGLRACDVDLLHGTLHVRHAVTRPTDGAPGVLVHDYPKGGKTRIVPFPPSLADRVRALLPDDPTSPCGCLTAADPPATSRACHPGEGPLFARMRRERRKGGVGERGEPGPRWMWPRSLGRTLATASARVGLSVALTPHDLRHTCASLAVAEGGTVLSVQHLLGHDSAVVTLNTYADLFPADLSDLMGRLDAGARKAAQRQRPDRPALGAV